MTIFYILFAILMFGFLVISHEFGHFVAAKALGVQVNEFAMGMGPVLWQRSRGETAYSLRALPIGGFCAMEGEDMDSVNPRAFTAKPWWKRVIILAAGTFMNFLTGLVIVLCIVSLADGYFRPVLSGFFDGGGMEAQGLRAGDELYRIDGERVYLYDDVNILLSLGDGVYDIDVKRDGKLVSLPEFRLEKGNYEVDGRKVLMYGMTFADKEEKTLSSWLRTGWYQTIDFARLVRLSLRELLRGKIGMTAMTGPVGLVDVMVDSGKAAETAALGFGNILYLTAFVAVNLAMMNLLPLPALDGGRIVCLLLTELYEKLSRRRLDPKYEGWLHAAGLAALFVLMILVTFQDAFRLVKGWGV